MSRDPHLDDRELLALTSADPPADHARAARHAAACARCRRELAHFLALRQAPRGGLEPGEGALLRTFALVRSSAPGRAERARFAAAPLVYDSRSGQLALAGIRAPLAGGHLAWRTTDADVEVRWGDGPDSEGVLTGQVLPHQPAAGEPVGDVWLEQTGAPPAWGLVGPSGEFTLAVPRARRWRILLRWGSIRLRLAP